MKFLIFLLVLAVFVIVVTFTSTYGDVAVLLSFIAIGIYLFFIPVEPKKNIHI